MELSKMFFRAPLTRAELQDRKDIFMSYFLNLRRSEFQELSRLYDAFQVQYSKAIPRKARSPVPPEAYFGHIYRVMLIGPCFCGHSQDLENTKVKGGHDLEEEVFAPAEADRQINELLGSIAAKRIKVLSLPGKHPGNLVTQEMRNHYYEAVLTSGDSVVMESFLYDHIDCGWDMEGLGNESRKRKIWEIENICKPLCDEQFRLFRPEASEIILAEFDKIIAETKLLMPH